jgi:hypothetical protein
MVIDLTSGGWVPKPGKIEKDLRDPRKAKSDGIRHSRNRPNVEFRLPRHGRRWPAPVPIPVEKSDEDGRYHLFGDLELAPPPPLHSKTV